MFRVTGYRQAMRELGFLFVILFLFTTPLAFPVGGEREAKAAEDLSGKVDDLVDIKEINPRIIVEIKYATEDNFTKKKLYESNKCFLRRSTAFKLDALQRKLEGMNPALFIRPSRSVRFRIAPSGRSS